MYAQNVSSRRGKKPAASRGFTLLEILVVLVILGLLASLVGPQVFRQLSGSKVKTAALQIEELSSALDLYRLEVGRYPSSDEGLQALIKQPSGEDKWNGPYLKKSVIRLDPWGNPYNYRHPGENAEFDLFSYGADNKEGGQDENQDIANWQ